MAKTNLFTVLEDLKAQCEVESADRTCSISGGGKCWLFHDHKSVLPISSDQITSLAALISYVAHETGKNEFRVERDFTNRFCIPNIKCLPHQEYERALRFLTEQIAFYKTAG